MKYKKYQRVARARYPREPGTVIDTRAGGYVRVQWDAGCEYEYSPSDLTPYVDANGFKPNDRIRHKKHATIGSKRESSGTIGHGDMRDGRAPVMWDNRNKFESYEIRLIELDPDSLQIGDAVNYGTNRGRITAWSSYGRAMVNWGSYGSATESLANLTKSPEIETGEPPMTKPGETITTGELWVPPTGTEMALIANPHKTGTIASVRITPEAATAIIRWHGETSLSAVPLLDLTPTVKVTTMAKKPAPKKFPNGSAVKSTREGDRGRTGLVVDDSRTDGYATVLWAGEKIPAICITADLYPDPNVGTEKMVGRQWVIPAATAAYPINTDAKAAHAVYVLPTVLLTETPGTADKATTTYAGRFTPGTGVHDSVTAAYCLEVAAEWAAIAHRITTKQEARDKAAARLLAAEARILCEAYIIERDDLNEGSEATREAMKDFEVPEIRAAWLAVADAARTHYAPKGKL